MKTQGMWCSAVLLTCSLLRLRWAQIWDLEGAEVEQLYPTHRRHCCPTVGEHRRNSPSCGEVWEGSWLYDSNKKLSLTLQEMIFVRGEVSPTAVTPKVTVIDLKPTFTYSVLQFLLLGKGNNYTPFFSARLWESCQRIFENPCSLHHSLKLLTTQAF